MQLIKNRAIGVVRFNKIDRESVAEPDMSGALLLALVLGFLLLLVSVGLVLMYSNNLKAFKSIFMTREF